MDARTCVAVGYTPIGQSCARFQNGGVNTHAPVPVALHAPLQASREGSVARGLQRHACCIVPGGAGPAPAPGLPLPASIARCRASTQRSVSTARWQSSATTSSSSNSSVPRRCGASGPARTRARRSWGPQGERGAVTGQVGKAASGPWPPSSSPGRPPHISSAVKAWSWGKRPPSSAGASVGFSPAEPSLPESPHISSAVRK
mmetsp:Transcript_20744/g.58353  ORF Transcript_20744/g.58353 Transcript_20744/m.58353 type:complete len:202 (-) Transcript_20744:728-1333(-)